MFYVYLLYSEKDGNFYTGSTNDKLVKSPKFRHACEGRHPEVFENIGFPLSRE